MRAPSSARTAWLRRCARKRRSASSKIIDATCPLVTKVHLEAVRFARDGYSIVLIGHKDHDEVIGTLGEVPDRSYLVETVEDVDALDLPDPARVRYLTQTTLSLDETRDIIERLKQRFPLIQGPHSQDICYATENRQMAVKAVGEHVDLLLVVGSENSSNSKRLVEVGGNGGVRSFLVNDSGDVDAGVAGGGSQCGRNRGSVGAGTPGAGPDRVPARPRL